MRNRFDMKTISDRLNLLVALSRHDIRLKYKGSVLGAIWGFIVPIVMLSVYTLIFSHIFKAKWAGIPTSGTVDYAVLLFIGLIVYQVFAEAVNRAPATIVQNANFVKKVVFPLHVLPVVPMASACYNALVSLASFAVFLAISSFGLHWQIVLLPVLVIPLLALTTGVCWVAAAFGVYLRDTDQFVQLLTRILQYCSPVLYPAMIFPPPVTNAIRLSPLALQIEQIRDLVVVGRLPELSGWIYSTTVSTAVLVGGYLLFQRLQKGFADAI